MHVPLSEIDPLIQLEKAVKLTPENEEGQRLRELYASLLGPGFQIGSQVRRAQTVTILTHRDKLNRLPMRLHIGHRRQAGFGTQRPPHS